MQSAALLEILYDALRSRFGVIVTTSNPEVCKAKLYALRRENPEFACLSFLVSPTDPGSSFWIIKKEPTDVETSSDEAHPEPS